MSKQTFKTHINKAIIDRLQVGDTVWDTELRGFGARRLVTTTSYFIKTRINGKQTWITIGKHGQPWTPNLARKRALELKLDPQSKSTRTANQNQTVADAFAKFTLDHLPKISPTTAKEYEAIFRRSISPALGETPITELTLPQISTFHNNLKAHPRSANIALSVLSKLLSWSEDQEIRPPNTNPCFRVKRFPETKRERFLSIEEIITIGELLADFEASGKISIYAAAAIRLLIFTGARSGEIKTLKWDYVDLKRRKLFLPRSKTGKKSISLSLEACAILEDIPRLANNPHVIVGQIEGAHLVNIAKPWNLIRTAAKLDDVRIHDLRHSFASFAAEKGASLVMIGKLLGHTQSQTTARYTHLTDASMTDLNDRIGDSLGKAMTPKKEASHE